MLDEPAAALDPLARRQFLNAVLEVVGDGGTVIFSTHLISDLERVADRIAVCNITTNALERQPRRPLTKHPTPHHRRPHQQTHLPNTWHPQTDANTANHHS